MALYCWGNTAHGELGLGGIEHEQILAPVKMNWHPRGCVCQVACGQWHSLFLNSEGQIFSCGCNDTGQLGHERPTKRPHLISELDSYVITKISCGARHSLAISEWGQLFSWGHNNCGQLGTPSPPDVVSAPKVVRMMIAKQIVQIACGAEHSMALSSCGEVYTWGSNLYGQLGTGVMNDTPEAATPKVITSLMGVPIAFIACGGYHSFVVSKSGAVFGWGRNNCGQLGLNDERNRAFPTQLKTLRSLNVRYIACGDEFSVFLNKDGGVFTCGSGTYGQLGHGLASDEMLPRMITELMGSTITQVACGKRHTLALVPSRGRVYGFGLGSSGQLGSRVSNKTSLPQVVMGPWVSPSGTSLLGESVVDADSSPVVINQIFSGGDHSLVTCTFYTDNIPAVDCRVYDARSQILNLTIACAEQCAQVPKDRCIDLDLLAIVEVVFKSQACLNGSFLLQDDKHFCCTSKHHGVDLEQAETAFAFLRRIENEALKQLIWDKLTNEVLLSLTSSPADVETLRIYLVLPMYHEFVNSKNYEKLHTPFSNTVLNLQEIAKKIVINWWADTPVEWFEQLVSCYRNVVAHIISFNIAGSTVNGEKRVVPSNPNLSAALKLLAELYRVNHTQRKAKVHYEVFHWEELLEYVDIQQDYIHWLFDKSPGAFNICNYPFLFNATVKTALLQADQAIQMHHAMQSAAAQSSLQCLLNGVPRSTTESQYIVLNVSRQNLVRDTLREITKFSQVDLKKPLKIRFYGEEAEDAGGVRKEFFMLLLKDLIDPKYGMFKEFEDSRAVWFADKTFETDDMYFLIGIICGLAIYNFTIINLPFPLALYKKILDEPVVLSDLYDLSPTLGRSMQCILDYNGDNFQEHFDLHFEISREIFGESKSEPLKPGGETTSVTLENREEFVNLYVDFIFNKGVESQFTAFKRGFVKVCWGRVLQLYRPEELMSVVVGNEDYDWKTMELCCEYKNGYTATDAQVKWFWEVFHELPESEKRKFLLYLTGTDRIPVQGMKEMKICIQPTNDDRFLPVAHTCFNLLDLPRYKTKQLLKLKLEQAIQQTQGFSLV